MLKFVFELTIRERMVNEMCRRIDDEVNDLTIVAESVPYGDMEHGQYWTTIGEYVEIPKSRPKKLIIAAFEELWIEHWFKRRDGTTIYLSTEAPISGYDFDSASIELSHVWEIGHRNYLDSKLSEGRTSTHRWVPLESSREFLSIKLRPKSC